MVRYKELDSLRGIAALLVVFFHFSMSREQEKLGFNLGMTGVHLFFIISGFVIVMSINQAKSTLEFIVNRFTRLYPTYWICVSVSFAVQLFFGTVFKIGDVPSIKQYVGNLTMFQFYLNVPNMEGAYWSMIIELLFYVFIALIFSLKLIRYVVPVSLIVVFIIALQYILPGTYAWQGYLFVRGVFPLLSHFCLFMAGIIFYKMKTGGKKRFLYYVLLLFLFVFQIPQFESGFVTNTEYAIMLGVYFLLFLLFVHEKLGFIITGPTLLIGKISFALYLIHQYISTRLILPYLIDGCHLNYWLAAGITFLTVVFLAAIITDYIEIPLGKKMNTALRKMFNLNERSSALLLVRSG